MQLSRVRARWLLSTTVIVISSILVACSSQGPSTAPTSSHSASGTPWAIGAIVDETGISSQALGVTPGVLQAWASWTNAQGGIDGHPIRVIALDDRSTPSVSLADAHTLIQGDHVLALVGSESSDAAAWGNYAKQQGVPIIGAGETTGLYLIGNSDFYPIAVSPQRGNDVVLQAAKEIGDTRVGTFYCAEAAACQAVVPLYTQAAKTVGGVTFVKGVAVSATAPSYVAPCVTMKEANVNAIVMNVSASTMPLIADQCAQQNYHPIILATSSGITPQWTSDPAFNKGGGVLDTFAWWNTQVPAIATFQQVLNKYDSGAIDTSAAVTAEVWESAMLFEAGAKAAHLGNNPTSAELIRGLNSLSDETLGGLTFPLTYANGNRTVTCAYLFDVANGKLALLNGGKPSC